MGVNERQGRMSVLGQIARVEVCPCGTWKVSVGSTTLDLNRDTAGDLCNTLAVALDRGGPESVDRLLVLETVEDARREN
ncbi:MAG TPA: hypothetical protein VH853_04500 [Polyangia bacterium]|nr:hypothetical protein [Polyangia bacterium]